MNLTVSWFVLTTQLYLTCETDLYTLAGIKMCNNTLPRVINPCSHEFGLDVSSWSVICQQCSSRHKSIDTKPKSQHDEVSPHQTAWSVMFTQCINGLGIMLCNVKLHRLHLFTRKNQFVAVPGYSNENKFQIPISLGFSDYSLSPLITAAL